MNARFFQKYVFSTLKEQLLHFISVSNILGHDSDSDLLNETKLFWTEVSSIKDFRTQGHDTWSSDVCLGYCDKAHNQTFITHTPCTIII